MNDGWAALIERVLEDGSDRSTAGELAALEALAPTERDAVLERLRVLGELREVTRPTRSDIERAAQNLGMKRANLYRLVARVKEHGPVAGLRPRLRVARTTAAPQVGLPSPAEGAVKQILRSKPDAPLSAIIEAVERAYEGSEDARPSDATIQRRVGVLRKAGGLIDIRAWGSDRTFGERIVIDQSAVAWPGVDVSAGLTICLIMDVQSRLIIGCGLGSVTAHSAGLRAAIDQARVMAPSFVVGRFKVADEIGGVRWVVPDDTTGWDIDFGDGEHRPEWEECLQFQAFLHTTAIHHGSQRHGMHLRRMIGPELGIFQLFPRMTSAAARKDLSPTPEIPDIADQLLATARDWNYRVLEAAAQAKPTSNPQVRVQRLRTWRASQSDAAVANILTTICDTLEDILDTMPKLGA